MMALQLGALRDALIEAGASADKADKAAEELAGYEDRFTGVEQKLTALEGKVNLLTWMVGFNLILSLGMLWRLLR
jgi:antibiotic biosynthesis monooxygenase (ABM) superfamily enzyme